MSGKEFDELLKNYGLSNEKTARLLKCSLSSITKWKKLAEIPQHVEYHLMYLIHPESLKHFANFLGATSLDYPNNTELKEFVKRKIEIMYWNNIDYFAKHKYIETVYPYQNEEDYENEKFIVENCGVLHLTKATIKDFFEYPGVNVKTFYKIVNRENKMMLEKMKNGLFISFLIENDLITITEYTTMLSDIMQDFERLRPFETHVNF